MGDRQQKITEAVISKVKSQGKWFTGKKKTSYHSEKIITIVKKVT